MNKIAFRFREKSQGARRKNIDKSRKKEKRFFF